MADPEEEETTDFTMGVRVRAPLQQVAIKSEGARVGSCVAAPQRPPTTGGNRVRVAPQAHALVLTSTEVRELKLLGVVDPDVQPAFDCGVDNGKGD